MLSAEKIKKNYEYLYRGWEYCWDGKVTNEPEELMSTFSSSHSLLLVSYHAIEESG